MKNAMNEYAILLKFLLKNVTVTEEKRILFASFLIISICLIKHEAGLLVESQGSGCYLGALRRW